MTFTTDSEDVRKAFEPYCPSNVSRLRAIKDVTEAGIKTCITMTPLLPIQDAKSFTHELLSTGVEKFIVQPFHPDKGKFVASTREAALSQMKKMNWSYDNYLNVVEIFRRELPWLGEGKQGFAPI
jgi:DNA repair photolyase